MYQRTDSGTSVERQLYILSILSQSTKGYTLQEMIEQLERVGIDATRRMVARDMDSISRNFYVYEETQDNQTIYKADKYAAAHMDFSISQMISLYYIKEILKSNRKLNISREAEEIIDKILGQMPALSQAALGEVQSMIKVAPSYPSSEKNVDEAILEQVRTAAVDKKRLNVEYTSFYTGETTQRPFDPYVLEVRGGCWHVIGWCHIRNSVRDLRISRITSAQLTEETFEIPKGFYEEYKRTRFHNLSGGTVYNIELEFTGHAAKLVREYHADMADSLQDTQNGLLFKKRAALTPDLMQWVLMFGAGVRVLAPEELANEIVDEAARIIKRYEGTNDGTA